VRVLIIGGTSFIGPYVARQLCDANHDVTVFHRGQHESAIIPPQVRHFRSESAVIPVVVFPRELLQPDFDVVIHMIAMGEADSRAAVNAFSGRSRRIVALSSGDVYLAYGRFIGLEPGPMDEGLLNEESPLRMVLYPYRAQAKSPDDLGYYYEKILVERELLGQSRLPATILRLPKVYGPGNNADLATVYGFRDHPQWRWTHGYVENVAAAILLAATTDAAAGHVYNVGEEHTPTVEERLRTLPPSSVPAVDTGNYTFDQDIAYDTSRIRRELAYAEIVSYEQGIQRTISSTADRSVRSIP
jgi:nucleoside-diphosphate-sugar epimerase